MEDGHVSETSEPEFRLKNRRLIDGSSARADRMALAVRAGSNLHQVAKSFGVSAVAVYKACKIRGVRSPRSRRR